MTPKERSEDEYKYAYKPHIPAEPLPAIIEPLKNAVGRVIKVRMYNKEERTFTVKAFEETHNPRGRYSGWAVLTPTGWINSRIIREVLDIVPM